MGPTRADIPPGTVVRHVGEQFPRARRDGTATVIQLGERTFGDGTFEVLVRHRQMGNRWWNSQTVVPVV